MTVAILPEPAYTRAGRDPIRIRRSAVEESTGRIHQMNDDRGRRLGMAVLTASIIGVGLQASSHREAPGITKTPKLDGSDFYMFSSYETGRTGFVTLLA